MTIITRNILMSAAKRVFSVSIMIKNRFRPGLAGMARAAICAAVAGVMIIIQVTGAAFGIHLVFEGVFRMAVVACQLGMFSDKYEVCIPAVIET